MDKMSQKNLFRLFIVLLVVLYSIIIFLVAHITLLNFWVNYLFVLLSPAVILVSTFLKKSTTTTFPYNIFYLKKIVIYAIIEVVLGSALMFIPMNVGFVLLIQIPMLIIFALILIYNSFGVSHVTEKVQEQKQQVNYLRTIEIKLSTAKSLTDSLEVKKEIDKLIEKIHYSDYNSNENVEMIEKQILELIDEMKYAQPDIQLKILRNLNALVDERNQTILLLKR